MDISGQLLIADIMFSFIFIVYLPFSRTEGICILQTPFDTVLCNGYSLYLEDCARQQGIIL